MQTRLSIQANTQHMHIKVKVLLASWLAGRAEIRTRKLRRALRDYQRAELRRIHAARKRSRGLRLYAAWSRRKNDSKNFGALVPLQMPSDDRRNTNAA
jgi:hypothetical protein